MHPPLIRFSLILCALTCTIHAAVAKIQYRDFAWLWGVYGANSWGYETPEAALNDRNAFIDQTYNACLASSAMAECHSGCYKVNRYGPLVPSPSGAVVNGRSTYLITSVSISTTAVPACGSRQAQTYVQDISNQGSIAVVANLMCPQSGGWGGASYNYHYVGTTPTYDAACQRQVPDPPVCERDTPEPNPQFGNPIDPVGGMKIQNELDFTSANGLLQVRRYYSSIGGGRWTWEGMSGALADFSGRKASSAFNETTLISTVKTTPQGYYPPGVPIPAQVDRAMAFPLLKNQPDTGQKEVWIQLANGVRKVFLESSPGAFTTMAADQPRLGATALSDGSSGWVFMSTTNETYVFDANGLLRQQYRFDGKRLDFARQDTALTLTAWPGGRALRYARSGGTGPVTSVTLPDGNLINYVVNSFGYIEQVTFPDGSNKKYLYNESGYTGTTNSNPGWLTGLIDENQVRTSSFKYDGIRPISTERADGVNKYSFYYVDSTSSGNTRVTLPNGTTQFLFNWISGPDGERKVSSQSQPSGSGCGPSSSALSYDANGNVSSSTDFNGVVTSYSYDLTRNLETRRVEAVGKPEARTVSTQWHSYWRLPLKVAEPKKLTTWVYNGDGGAYCAPTTATVPSITGGTQPIGVLCSKTEQATSDANGASGFGASVVGTPRTWKYTYNAFGQVLTADGPRTDVVDRTTTTYYDAADPNMGKRGNVATITNALGHVTQITAYDLNGNPLTIIDPNGVVTTLTYDLRQRLTSRTVGGETTSYGYDAVGQLLKVTLPDGSFTAYTYDPAHRLTAIADALGNSIAYTLDAMGNRTKEEVKDPAGQLARTRSRIFDALSRLAQDIGAQGQTTRYEYDANGNRTKVTDPLNQVTVSAYDPLNRLIQVTDPGTGVTRYGYDGQDRLAQVTDPRNLATTYTVDGLGNRQTLQSPDTGNTTSTYDAAGNELTRTDAKGQVTTTLYDALNRPVRITYQDGSRVQYTWDIGTNGLGRLGKIDEYGSTGTLLRSLSSSYDPQGRLLGETRTLGNVAHTIAYSYSTGLLRGLTLPSAKQLSYTRNAAGQITQVNLTANGQTKTLLQNISYHPFGGIKTFTDGAGQVHSRGNDQDGRTSSYTLGNQTWLLSYDAASRIAGQIDAGNAANSATYGYDPVDRLTAATLPATTYGYGYDATGNRTAQTTGSTTRSYTTAGTSNRVQSLSNPSQTLSYDANGSLTGDGTNQYAYDPRGRLTQAITAAGTTTYQINALGQRVRKTNSTNGTDVLYHYDRAGHLIAESNAGGTIVREYVWLDDIPVAVLQ